MVCIYIYVYTKSGSSQKQHGLGTSYPPETLLIDRYTVYVLFGLIISYVDLSLWYAKIGYGKFPLHGRLCCIYFPIVPVLSLNSNFLFCKNSVASLHFLLE